ncbi:MAG: glycosyltransferase family 4 protein [Gemmatimonadaceae bacterium]
MTRRIRVLLASPLPPPEGGIASWTQRMLSVDSGVDIDRRHVNMSVGAHYHFTGGVDVGRLGRQGLLTMRVVGAIVRARPDVFHLTSSYDRAWSRDSMLLSSARMMGAATIINLRGGDFQRFYDESPTTRQQRIVDTLAACSAVVPITSETTAFLASLGLRNVRPIPNCIDIGPLPPRAPLHGRIRWLFVGWIMPAKGIKELFKAFRAFTEDTLTLVGPIVAERGEDSAGLLKAFLDDPALRGRVKHVAHATPAETRTLYAEHDAFVFPSRREGFPNVVLEAMESGLPIVASRVGATPEMIRDGLDGVLVPTRNAAALEAAMRRVRNAPSLAARIGASARERVVAHYNVHHISALWTTLYRELGHL